MSNVTVQPKGPAKPYIIHVGTRGATPQPPGGFAARLARLGK